MEIVSLILSLLAIIISTSVAMWGWWRHRNIYDVERLNYREKEQRKKLKEKLNTGNFTVLSSSGDYPDLDILIGKLKK